MRARDRRRLAHQADRVRGEPTLSQSLRALSRWPDGDLANVDVKIGKSNRAWALYKGVYGKRS